VSLSRINISVVRSPERGVCIWVGELGKEHEGRSLVITPEVARRVADLILSASVTVDAMGGSWDVLKGVCQVTEKVVRS
jgi:hypothetical protein